MCCCKYVCTIYPPVFAGSGFSCENCRGANFYWMNLLKNTRNVWATPLTAKESKLFIYLSFRWWCLVVPPRKHKIAAHSYRFFITFGLCTGVLCFGPFWYSKEDARRVWWFVLAHVCICFRSAIIAIAPPFHVLGDESLVSTDQPTHLVCVCVCVCVYRIYIYIYGSVLFSFLRTYGGAKHSRRIECSRRFSVFFWNILLCCVPSVDQHIENGQVSCIVRNGIKSLGSMRERALASWRIYFSSSSVSSPGNVSAPVLGTTKYHRLDGSSIT